MEIRDPIHGTLDLTPGEVAVIDSFAYQRLRAIKQLGFSEFSFPGATHNRYLHSIGVSHLAGRVFDSVFRDFQFSNNNVKTRLRTCVKLAALLHDIGHGPLSHTTEEAMPKLSAVDVKAYENRRRDIILSANALDKDRRANHEDYTIKFVTDSSLTQVLEENFPELTPFHIACLIDKTLAVPDTFFVDQGIDFRVVLSQVVSSELDADRMDYLERDAYFCGTNYGRVELSWLISNLGFHVVDGTAYLALNRRALYSFDDFLLARHHMHLMVYFHHKAIVYEEMLHRYLSDPEASFQIPASVEEYIHCTDYSLYQHLAKQKNEWARRISERRPYKVLFELHTTRPTERTEEMQTRLNAEGIPTILASSTARLSKYHSMAPEERAFPIYVVDDYDLRSKPYRIEESTEIFQKYEEIRRIERLYVAPENFDMAEDRLAVWKL